MNPHTDQLSSKAPLFSFTAADEVPLPSASDPTEMEPDSTSFVATSGSHTHGERDVDNLNGNSEHGPVKLIKTTSTCTTCEHCSPKRGQRNVSWNWCTTHWGCSMTPSTTGGRRRESSAAQTYDDANEVTNMETSIQTITHAGEAIHQQESNNCHVHSKEMRP